jgi:predicted aconitase with swiveling domain
LTIDPGVEVQFAPGVQLSIGGTLRAGGNPSAPVRLVGPNGRWDGIVGTPGSTIALDAVQIRQAGQNGTALSSSGGTIVVRNSILSDNGGGIVALGSVLDLRNTQISGNTIGGPAVNLLLPKQNGSTIAGNIIGGNGTAQGAPQLLITGEAEPGDFVLENNTIIGETGPGAIVTTAAPLRGAIRCNAFNKGTIGLLIQTSRPDATGFNLAVSTNSFTGQTRFGAAGSVAFNLANNWWGDPSGPLEAQRNPQGRGVPVGVTLQFQPWLTDRPACVPQ